MYLGIDVGGTSVKYGVLSDLKLIDRGSVPTPKDPSDFGKALCEIVERITARHPGEIRSIGVGVPGFLDQKSGTILNCTNLSLDGFPLRDCIRRVSDLPVFLENDANCAAIGEYTVNPRKPRNMILVTLGTGVGGGLILNGSLYSGAHGQAGELGHITVEAGGRSCPCGKRGCLEQYASATALVSDALHYNYETEGELYKAVKTAPDKLDARVIFSAIRNGDEDAKVILDRYCSYLGAGIESFVEVFDPDEIVLAGGITNESDVLGEYLNRHVTGRCPVYFAVLKSDAGLLGAAGLGLHNDL